MDDPDGLDPEIRDALAVALNEKRLRISVKLTDRRLILLYVLVVALWVGLLVMVQRDVEASHRFERAVVENCEANRKNTVGFNDFLDKLITSYQSSPLLNERQRRLRSAFLATAKQTVPTCPPRR